MTFVYDLGEGFHLTAEEDPRTGRVEDFQLEFRGGGTHRDVITSIPRAQVEQLQLAISVFFCSEMRGETA